MSSREYWGAGPPPRRMAPEWDQYHDMTPHHYNERPRPPRDDYYNLPPPPPPPPPFYEDDLWHHDERPPHPPLPPIKRPPLRGAFRGRRGKGEGVGRGSWNNGPKPPAKNDAGKKSNASAGVNNPSTGKPAWMMQSSNQDKTSVSNSSPDKKPAWLTQSPSQANTNTTNASITTDSKPAWLKDTSSENKPAWLSQPVSQLKTDSNTSNVSGNMPAWLSTPAAKNNSVTTSSPSTMPAWLQSNSHNNQAMTTTNQATAVTITDTARSQSPPPPPPPSHPPPKNQPKIHPVPTPSPSTFPMSTSAPQMTKQMNKAKNKALAEVKVPAPGGANFISFKNSLQEYSQKKGFYVPVYHTFKNNYGHSARVDVAKKTFQSSGIQKDKKEAEQNAAYEALKGLGLLEPTVVFTSPSGTKAGTKRPQPTPQAVAKKLKGEIPTFNNSPNFKCQLNEFCQKFHLPVPTYETAHDVSGYVTTLVYNKKVYLSTSPQSTKKAAEQNAAQLVLSKVNQAPPPMDQNQQMILQNFVAASSAKPEPSTSTTTPEPPKPESISLSSAQDLTAKNITPMISYKNKLQEVCQKKKTFLPVYDTHKEGNVYNCKVAIDGKVFNAQGCKTKKGAEQSAARVALQALGLLNE